MDKKQNSMNKEDDKQHSLTESSVRGQEPREATASDEKTVGGKFEKKDNFESGEPEDNNIPAYTPTPNSGEDESTVKSGSYTSSRTISEKTRDQLKQRTDKIEKEKDIDPLKCKERSASKLLESDPVPGKNRSWTEFMKDGKEKVVGFYKSDFAVFMFYTSLTAIGGGVVGAIVTLIGVRYIPLSEGPPATDVTTTTTSAPATTLPPQSPNSIEEAIKEIRQELQQCRTDRRADKKVIGNLSDYLDNLNADFSKLSGSVDTIKTETQDNYSLLTEDVKLKNYVVDSQITELKDVFVAKEWLFLIFLMGLFEIAVIGVVWVMWQKLTDSLRQMIRRRSGGSHVTESVANGRMNTVGGRIQGDRKTLKRVEPCGLEKRICVVSFHSESVSRHTAKVKDILSQNEATERLPVVQFLICRHDDILQMPPSKLYMVFVDFNERNVILEDPNKGLGDLRLTTVQAIDKMGADAVVIYSGDKGSNTLTSGGLYNTDLASVRQHSELCRLDRGQRMLSVFEKFSKAQIDHIVKVAKDV